MKKSMLAASASAALLVAATHSLLAADPTPPTSTPAIVSHIKVLSNNVEDISSLDAWKKSFIHDGMTEEQKALAVWTTVVKFRQQTAPPNEYLENETNVHDPIKDFNVYGYGMCCCASAAIESLSRYAGMETRGWGINNHSVPEVKIDNHWSLLDASLINYFRLPDGNGGWKIAGVMEISDSIVAWLKEHPDYQKFSDHKQYYDIMRVGQWKKIGPEVLKGSATYDDNGWQPAHTHAWGDTIFEYGSNAVPIKAAHIPFLTEYSTAVGYEVNIQLRPGEKLIRNWSNKGLDINQLEKGKPAPILSDNPQDPKTDFGYAPKYGDLTDNRVGNGTIEYQLPLNSLNLRSAMLTIDNLSTKEDSVRELLDQDANPSVLRVKDSAMSGILVFRMPSSYVYLGGELDIDAVVKNGGSIAISLSDNNGLDWKPLATITTAGDQKIDLKPFVYRRYDYRLKFELKGASTGLNSVKLTHDIQHSQRPLPILTEGDNKISFSAGSQEGTITVMGNLARSGTDSKDAKNLLLSDFHPILTNLEPSNLRCQSAGSAIIPISTPGDITRLRLGIMYRATTPDDTWNVEASYDNGKSFSPVATLTGPNHGDSRYYVLDKVPPHTQSAQIRVTGKAHAPDNLCIQDLRLSADYLEPHGAFAPVKVTYAWEEAGQPKSDIHIASSPEDTYTIHCSAKPKMKSITLELAP